MKNYEKYIINVFKIIYVKYYIYGNIYKINKNMEKQKKCRYI